MEKEKETERKPGILKKMKQGKMPGKDQFVIFILAGILLIVIALPTTDKTSKNEEKSGLWDRESDRIEKEEVPFSGEEETGVKKTETEEYEAYLENKLEQVLSVMEGAGKVKVTVAVGSSSERVVEKDTPTVTGSTSETDAEGGSRKIDEVDAKEETVYTKAGDGSSVPYVIKTIQPRIEGVVVVAQGADNPEVINNITGAIVALFDMEPHKIKVVKMKSE